MTANQPADGTTEGELPKEVGIGIGIALGFGIGTIVLTGIAIWFG